jgi:rsbT co-antagonist protein RsbR
MKQIFGSTFTHSENRQVESDVDSLAWFDLGPSDRQETSALQPIADEVADEIIDDFYSHILGFDSAARQFASQNQIERVKAAQKQYFKDLVSAPVDDHYITERRRIGSIHEAAGITPTLYIGAYAYYLSRLGHLIREKAGDNPDRAFRLYLALQKFAHFDMALALETYVEAREQTIESQQRELSELPTPVLKLRDGLILIPVVGTLDGTRARMLTVTLLDGIREHRARAIVLDITGVAVVDSAVANHLIQTMQAARLMGASLVLTGVSAEVAQALIKIGVTLEGLKTAGDLQSGIEAAESFIRP